MMEFHPFQLKTVSCENDKINIIIVHHPQQKRMLELFAFPMHKYNVEILLYSSPHGRSQRENKKVACLGFQTSTMKSKASIDEIIVYFVFGCFLHIAGKHFFVFQIEFSKRFASLQSNRH